MIDEVPELRRRLGGSTVLWTHAGETEPLEDGWIALSGTRSVDYNVVFWTGDGPGLDAAVERLLAARVPGVVMVAGPALAEVGRLVARDWVCVGATPLMVRPIATSADREAKSAEYGAVVKRIEASGDLALARALVAEVFEIESQLAAIALPEPGIGEALWGAFDADGTLLSCLALVTVQETVVVWSMATTARARGRGCGRQVLEGALAAAAGAGAERVLLYASSAGEPFYRRLGFREVERWQTWSRPRWVLGRA